METYKSMSESTAYPRSVIHKEGLDSTRCHAHTYDLSVRNMGKISKRKSRNQEEPGDKLLRSSNGDDVPSPLMMSSHHTFIKHCLPMTQGSVDLHIKTPSA